MPVKTSTPIPPSGPRVQNKQTQTREIHRRAGGEARVEAQIDFLSFPNELMLTFASFTLFCWLFNSVVHINQMQSSLSQQLLLRFPHFPQSGRFFRRHIPPLLPSAAALLKGRVRETNTANRI